MRRGEEGNPFLMLHREMNRLFDDFFRGFDLVPFGADRVFGSTFGGWPSSEVSDTDKEVKRLVRERCPDRHAAAVGEGASQVKRIAINGK